MTTSSLETDARQPCV